MQAKAVAQYASDLIGEEAIDVRSLHGGDLSEVVAIRFKSGLQAVAKGGPDPRAEARMLEAMRQASAPVPTVLACSGSVLVMEQRAEEGSADSSGWAELGQALRLMHSTTGQRYGWEQNYAFGTVPIPNHESDDWLAFWADRRLTPSLPFLTADLARRLEHLSNELGGFLPHRPPASLLHGDLWAGNIVWSRGRLSALIDPACCFGDAEVDLAMLHLFGSPGPEFALAYGDLPDGWEERRAIYQLWPALVHVRLFGGGYLGLVERLLARVGF